MTWRGPSSSKVASDLMSNTPLPRDGGMTTPSAMRVSPVRRVSGSVTEMALARSASNSSSGVRPRASSASTWKRVSAAWFHST